MAEKQVTFEDLKAMVGKDEQIETIEIDRAMLRKYAESIGDSNPKWKDNMPPGFICTAMMSTPRTHIPLPYKRVVDGGGDWEFYKPVKVGDVITTTHRFAETFEKEPKPGEKRLFVIFEAIHKNQKGEVVAKSQATAINF